MPTPVGQTPGQAGPRLSSCPRKSVPHIDRRIPEVDAPREYLMARFRTQISKARRRRLTGCIVAIAAFGLLWTVASLPSETAAYDVHEPIMIDGDDDFTEANGITGGSGTEVDPFVIEGWEIAASSGAGVHVRNTAAHAVIRGVYVHGPGESSLADCGIYLDNVSHCAVESSQIGACEVGLWMAESDNVSVSTCHIYSCTSWAVRIVNSVDLEICSVDFVPAVNGISGVNIANAEICDCNFSTSMVVVNLNGARNVLLEGLNVSDCQYGMMLAGSSITAASNSFVRCDYPIQAFGVQSAQVLYNDIDDAAGTGIYASISDLMMICENTISRCDFGGIILEQCTNSLIANNTLTNNTIPSGFTGAGVLLLSSTNISVYHNFFLANTPSQAEDDMGTENYWDDGYPSGGNFWLDYAGYDNYSGEFQNTTGSDGIGDTPYVIDGNSQDGYPLVEPIPEFEGVIVPVIAIIAILSFCRRSRSRRSNKQP